LVLSENTNPSPSEQALFRQVLMRHVTRYPRFEIQDLYKLIYQGTLGSEHAVTDAAEARLWLEREVEVMADGPEEPVIDPISADGQIVRVNLRPYVAEGGDLEALLESFLRTANEYKGTEAQLRRYWLYAEHNAEEGILGWAVKEMKDFFGEMERQGFPAVHHSKVYTMAYRPAYRVVMQEYLIRE